jgi:undecaprenyl-diphosphatase
MDWLESIILGLVQGVTEFLPISSDGHLSVFQMLFARLTGESHTGQENLFFDVMLHLGTTAAILLHYRKAVIAGARGLLGSESVPEGFRRAHVVRVGLLAFVGTLPLIPDALYFKKLIEQALVSSTATGVGFLITAAVLGVTALLRGGDKGPAETTWLDALLVGVAQAFAPLPGVSRSGLTIAAALALGFRKSWAVGFSLLLAVPAVMGAAVLELKDVPASSLTAARISQTLVATILAGAVGYAAIVWLVRIVRQGRLWYFSVYLVILGIVVLTGVLAPGDRPDGRRAQAMDGPVRLDGARSGPPRDPARFDEPLHRSLQAGAGSDAGTVGERSERHPRHSGLDVGRPLERGPGATS